MSGVRARSLVLTLAVGLAVGVAMPNASATDEAWTKDQVGANDLNHTAGVVSNARDSGKFGTGATIDGNNECALTIDKASAFTGSGGEHEIGLTAVVHITNNSLDNDQIIASAGNYAFFKHTTGGNIEIDSPLMFSGDRPIASFSVQEGKFYSMGVEVEAFTDPSDINVQASAFEKGTGFLVKNQGKNVNLDLTPLDNVDVTFGDFSTDDTSNCSGDPDSLELFDARFYGVDNPNTKNALLNFSEPDGANGDPLGDETHMWIFQTPPAPTILQDASEPNHDFREKSNSPNTPVERQGDNVTKYWNGTWGGGFDKEWSVRNDDPGVVPPVGSEFTEWTVGYALNLDLDESSTFLSKWSGNGVTPFEAEVGANAFKNDVRVFIQECDGDFQQATFENFLEDEQFQTLTIQFRENEDLDEILIDVRKNGGEKTGGKLLENIDACFEDAFRYENLNVNGVLYEQRMWHKVVQNDELDAWANQQNEKYKQRLKGDEVGAWMFQNVSAGETVEGSTTNETDSGGNLTGEGDTGGDEDLDTQPQAGGLRVEYSNDPRVVSYTQEPSGDGALTIFDDNLTKQNTFRSCHAKGTDDSDAANALGLTYDSWILTLCQSETTTGFTLESYSFQDGTVGSFEFATCNGAVPHDLHPTTLNRVLWVDRDGCKYRADAVAETTARAPGASNDQDIAVSHQTQSDQHAALITDETTDKLEVFTEVGGTQIGEVETDERAVAIHNRTVYTFGENDQLKRWELFHQGNESTENLTLPASPNATLQTSVTVDFGNLRLSKDGQFLMSTHGSVIKLWSTRPLQSLDRLSTGDPVHAVDMDRCNNHLFAQDESLTVHRFNVASVTNSTAGDGNPNPCPGEDEGTATQSTEDSSGEPSQVETGEETTGGGDDQLRDDGLAGNTTFQNTGNALGISADDARLVWAGLIIAAMAMTFVAIASGSGASLSAESGTAAIAGASTGAVVSLGLGLLPVWVFVLAAVIAIAGLVFMGGP